MEILKPFGHLSEGILTRKQLGAEVSASNLFALIYLSHSAASFILFQYLLQDVHNSGV